jgi:hypothetical protein
MGTVGKAAGREAEHSPSSNDEVKNGVFMAHCLIN